MVGRKDLGLRTAVTTRVPNEEAVTSLLSSRTVLPKSKAKIAVAAENIQWGRQTSSATRLHLRLGVILNQRRRMGSVARIGVGNMAMVEGDFP